MYQYGKNLQSEEEYNDFIKTVEDGTAECHSVSALANRRFVEDYGFTLSVILFTYLSDYFYCLLLIIFENVFRSIRRFYENVFSSADKSEDSPLMISYEDV